MAELQKEKLISSIALLAKTGLSRATLNNYIKMGMIPPPIVKKPEDPTLKAKQIGYFQDSVLDRIERIKQYKREGRSMGEISSLVSLKTEGSLEERFSEIQENGPGMMVEKQGTANEKREIPGPSIDRDEIRRRENPDISAPETEDIQLTLHDLNCPAYLINNKFEIEWINAEAEEMIFGRSIRSIHIAEARNVFRLLMDSGSSLETRQPIIDFHMSLFARRFNKEELDKLYPAITKNDIRMLSDTYDHVDDDAFRAVSETFLNLTGDPKTIYKTQNIQFREGTFCVFAPADKMMQGVAVLLSSRGRLIQDLLKQRMPTLMYFSVLVADLQDSVRVCAELPPEEYFSLINQIWKCMEGSFKKYYGIYGKHTGDGMVYYFLKNRDSNYLMNPILCALELRESIMKLSNEWKISKGWFNDLFMNIGINEGEEYFGMIPAAPSIEFTALGDSVNYAGRLSDLARYGSIWTTKNLINRLSEEERKRLRYGIHRKEGERDVLIENVFSRVMDLVPQDSPRNFKFKDIATLPVTEIFSRR